ncbi:MAG: hypothetical protein EBU90_12065 [Proteobacteria bacterium]|nr:hypothetical protein [Pseudomonadota bacterium]NBP14816.1 hypothetical protein [bacterium]
MKVTSIDKVLNQIYSGPSKWELDNVIYHDRLSDIKGLQNFLLRIKFLKANKSATPSEKIELTYLLELLADISDADVAELLTVNEEDGKDNFIEELARTSALETLTMGRLNYATLDTACKLNPNDFILVAKRTQDLINQVQGLAVKGENLSSDVAGA